MLFYFHADEQLAPKQSVRRGSNGVFYNPDRKSMEDLRWRLLLQTKKCNWTRAARKIPLRAKIIATFKRARGQNRDFETHPRGDIDNFQKFLFDACTGPVFEDDVQIRHLVILKQWGNESSYDLWVAPYDECIESLNARINRDDEEDDDEEAASI